MNRNEPAGLKPRLFAVRRLKDVLAGGRFAPFAAGEIADPRDRALANRLVTTALRRHGQLSVIMAQMLAKGMPRKSGGFEAVLRLSVTQVLFLPDLGDHSALYLGGEILRRDAKGRHLAGLLNAVLRRVQAEAETLRTTGLDALLPVRLAEGWREIYGDAALHAFIPALLDGAPLDLTTKPLSAEQAAELGGERLLGPSVRLIQRDRPVEALPFYGQGLWWVQDVAAALPAQLIDLPQGARVLDLCAAPGGKTAQLALAGYKVTALDNDPVRLERVGQNLARLALTAELVEGDATSFVPAEKFDAVLLDAPCSATGTFRRHPEVIWHRSPKDVAGRVALQRSMLERAAACLNPGGVLVYCVCSLESEEGEAQAEWVAKTLPDLVPDPIRPGPRLPEGSVTEKGYLRTHPGLALLVAGGMDGFFAARFRRKG